MRRGHARRAHAVDGAGAVPRRRPGEALPVRRVLAAVAACSAVWVLAACTGPAGTASPAASGSASASARTSASASGASRSASSEAPAGAALPRPDHVLVVVMENHGYPTVMGGRDAPWLSSLP
ncbi:MAG: hypothetical protein ACLGIA_01505, partial [Actinomycetes bacterium]